MEILDKFGASFWIVALINGRWVKAKLYDKPSNRNLNNDRIRTLLISSNASYNPEIPVSEQMCYHYCEGQCVKNELHPDQLKGIIRELETIPRILR